MFIPIDRDSRKVLLRHLRRNAQIQSSLIYFAFPKCASEWMRKELRLQWRNIYDANDWAKCDIAYCHVQPSRFLQEKCVNVDGVIMFTIVRNTYDRLASAWRYGVAQKHSYALGRTFKEFITWIYEHRDDLTMLPFCWMYLPMDVYFGRELLDKIRVFQMDKLDELTAFLKGNYGISVNTGNIVNKTLYDVDIVYDSEMMHMVYAVYSYEIDKFGYSCKNAMKI